MKYTAVRAVMAAVGSLARMDVACILVESCAISYLMGQLSLREKSEMLSKVRDLFELVCRV